MDPSIEQPWTVRRLIGCAALVLAGVLVCLDAWVDIYNIARRDEEASQVWLVPVVVGWLIWTRRQHLRDVQLGSHLMGPALIAIGWAVSWFGYHNAIQSFWHGGAVMVAVGCLATVMGRDFVARFWPALAVLVFLVPVPAMARQQVAIPLQTATASVTQFVFELIGVEVYRSGNVLQYNGMDVAVAEACNGMRMVFVLILVCYAVAFASPLRAYVRVLILVLSPLCAIVCNVVRLVPTVWVYGRAPQPLADSFHELSGWAMIFVAFLLVMGVLRLLQWTQLPVMQPQARTA
ncbi:MAG TPA: exosortase/archaeosortase family protein [Phycisphaeraceae bacterium]